MAVFILVGGYAALRPLDVTDPTVSIEQLADEYLSFYDENGWLSFGTENYYSPNQIQVSFPKMNGEQATRFGEIYTDEIKKHDVQARQLRKQALVETYTHGELSAMVQANRDPNYASAASKRAMYADKFFEKSKELYNKAQTAAMLRARDEGLPF